MSALSDLAAIVRNCDTAFLDTRYDMLADPGDIAEGLYAAVRSEVLHEEASNLRRVEREETPEGALGTRTGLLKAALVLDERADSAGENSSREADATPDFFQPGRTYRSACTPYTAPELIITFRVEHVTRHPDRGHRRAIGWMRSGEPGAKWHGDFRDEHEFCGWTDVTSGGEGE